MNAIQMGQRHLFQAEVFNELLLPVGPPHHTLHTDHDVQFVGLLWVTSIPLVLLRPLFKYLIIIK